MKKSVTRKECLLKKSPVLFSAVVLTVVLLVCALGLWLGDNTVGADRQLESAGDGDRTSPCRIETVEDFLNLQRRSVEGETFEGTYFLQTADLDFSLVEDFQPIRAFSGIYNGGGHRITGVRIGADSGEKYAAIFREMNGTLMNLGTENCTFAGEYAAGLVCLSDSETAGIYNCYSTADVSGGVAGGIAASFTGKIVSCFAGIPARAEDRFAPAITVCNEVTDENGVTTRVTETLTAPVCGGICGVLSGAVIECTSPSQPVGYRTSFSAVAGGDTAPGIADGISEALFARFAGKVQEYANPQGLLYSLLYPEAGNDSDPFLIRNAEEFCRMRDLVNAGVSFDACHFRQTADLNLSGVANFTPIGRSDTGAYFWGVYNGDGHTLSGLVIDAPDMDTGLFNRLAGTVMNLGIESGVIRGNCIGSFTGDNGSDRALILNCYSKATLRARGRAGGIADRMFSASVVNCCFTGEIEAAGGSFGITTFQTTGRVINCRSTKYEPIGAGTDSNYNSRRVDTAEEAFRDVSKSIYDSYTRISVQNPRLYRMNTEGFGNVYPMKAALLWREALVLLVFLFVLLAALFAGAKYAHPETGITPKEFVTGKLPGRLAQLTDTRERRMRNGFFLTFGFCALMVLIGVLCGDKMILNASVYSCGEDAFMDFFNPMHTALTRNVKEIGYFTVVGETYPPLAQGILWLFGQFLPADIAQASAFDVRSTAYGMMLFFGVLAGAMLILYGLFLHSVQCGGRSGYFLPILFLFCPPIIFMIERGNILILAFVASALFVAGYRSENPLIRNLSYACLGFAAAIKIYPAVLGLLVLRERNGRHTLQCLSWGVGFMLIPFAFCGGMTSLSLYIRNVSVSFQKHSLGHDKWLLNYSNTLYWFAGDTEAGVHAANAVSGWSLYLLTALLLAAGLLCRKHWKGLLCAVLILLLYPGFSLYYMGAFLFLPLFAFFREERHSRLDWLYLALLALPLLPLQFLCGIYGVGKYTLPVLASLAVLSLALLVIAETAVSLFRQLRIKKETCPTDRQVLQ